MLTLYLISLIVGGSLLLLSIALGSDGDGTSALHGDVGHSELLLESGDTDVGSDFDAADGFDSWLPIASLRFWTFFAAFFGLVGTALTLMSPLALPITGAASAGVGYICGVGATRSLRMLTAERIGKVLGSGDFVGITGTLMLPAGPGQPGKVRLKVGGRILEVLAHSDDEAMEIGSRVLVIGRHGAGGVLVSPALLLEGRKDKNE